MIELGPAGPERPHHACPIQRRKHIITAFGIGGVLIAVLNVVLVAAAAERDHLEIAMIVVPMTAAVAMVTGFATWTSGR